MRFCCSLVYGLLLSSVLSGCGKDTNNDQSILSKIKESKWGEPYTLIAHAGGGIEGKSYTNSKEAIINSLEDGKVLIELDLGYTSDNILVAVHHWSHTKKISNFGGSIDEIPLTYGEFKQLKIYGKYTPVSISDINKIMADYPQMILVTDKLRKYDILIQNISDVNRVLVECFVISECNEAVNLGFKNVAFNVDLVNWNIDETINDLKSSNIKAVTSSAKQISENFKARNNAKKLLNANIVNLSYSSNDEEFIKHSLGQTVSAFYTDFWSLKSSSCSNNSNKCNTY